MTVRDTCPCCGRRVAGGYYAAGVGEARPAEPTASDGTTQGQTKATHSTGTYAGGAAGEADND